MAIPFLPRRDEPQQEGDVADENPTSAEPEDATDDLAVAGQDDIDELVEAPTGDPTGLEQSELGSAETSAAVHEEVTMTAEHTSSTAAETSDGILAPADDLPMDRHVDMSVDDDSISGLGGPLGGAEETAPRHDEAAPVPDAQPEPGPVHAIGDAPQPPEDEVVPPLGVDHAERLLAERARDRLRPGGGPELARPARVIALANQKGGVGKTTTTINLGAALAELGARVLLVDIDPQGSLGVGLGADPHSREATVYNLLLMDGTDIDEVLIETNVENLHLLPANIDLAAAELLLVQEVAREQALRRVVERVLYRYDFVLIDCPPSLGLLTINGLTAADGVIVPLEAEYFALRGMSLLMQTLEKVQARLNPQLKLEGIVATMFDGRTLHAREVLERVRSAFGDTVYKTTINKTIRFAEAPVAGEPILTYRPRSKGSDAYRDLAREVLAREPSS